mgnify:CR=1 FL=1
MDSICGANCNDCEYGKNKNCNGCRKSNGCPFGNQCFIAKYILTGGKENYEIFKNQLIDEFNSLNISGMPKIKELFPLNGSFVNLKYPLSSGNTVEFLNNDEIYLGNQVECEFIDGELIRCFGLVANMDFLLVSEYGANGENPEIILYKKR